MPPEYDHTLDALHYCTHTNMPIGYLFLGSILAILACIYLLTIGDRNWNNFWDSIIFFVCFLCGMCGFAILFYCGAEFMQSLGVEWP